MRSLQIVTIWLVLAAACSALSTCPQGWTVLEQRSGPSYPLPLKVMNEYRDKFNAHYPDHCFGAATYDAARGKVSESFTTRCNVEYLLSRKAEGLKNVNVTLVSLTEGSAATWHVKSEKGCYDDWDSVMRAWFEEFNWPNLDIEHLCIIGQLNTAGCSYNCFEANLEGDEKAYVSLMQCEYGTNCDPKTRSHTIHVDCPDVCAKA